MANIANGVKLEGSPEPVRASHHDPELHLEAPLAFLPAPLELLILATRYVDAAHRLTPSIARGFSHVNSLSHSSPGHHQDSAYTDTAQQETADTHTTFISIYRRYMTAALAACGSAVKLGGPDVRLNLQARLMLAQLLATETCNAERAEQVMAKGLAIASSHESLLDYRFQFMYLQIDLSLSEGKIKFAKNMTKKAAVEIYQNHPTMIAWLYRFQLLFIRICDTYEHDYPSAVALIGDMVQQTSTRQHLHFSWTLTTMKARLAMLKGDSQVASTILFELARDYKLAILDSDIPDPQAKFKDFEFQHVNRNMDSLPSPLLLQFLILLSIHQTHIGQTIAARQNIRRAQYYLDQKASQEDAPGASATLSVPIILDTGELLAGNLSISTLPRTVLYAYTFLISTIVQLDPIGRQPKCLHFASAGLERLTEMLDFGCGLPADEAQDDSEYAYGPIDTMADTVKCLIGMNLDLLLTQGELLLMRSNVSEVHTVSHVQKISIRLAPETYLQILTDLVTISRSYNLWEEYKARIVTLQGMFFGFLGDLEKAFAYHALALDWIDESSHLGIVNRASLLLIRMAQGCRVRLSGNDGQTRSPSPKKEVFEELSRIPAVKREISAELETDEDLEGFAKQILRDCDQDIPSLKILELVIEAIVNGEISKAKRNLSLALQLSSDIGNQHMKPIILALLACRFTNTRNDQAFRMLHSAHTICGSLGGADRHKDKLKKVRSEDSSEVKEAGLAELGLWLGERLLETYELDKLEPKVIRQKEQNERYRRALLKQQELLRGII